MNRGIDQQTCRQTDKQINRKQRNNTNRQIWKYIKDRQIKKQTARKTFYSRIMSGCRKGVMNHVAEENGNLGWDHLVFFMRYGCTAARQKNCSSAITQPMTAAQLVALCCIFIGWNLKAMLKSDNLQYNMLVCWDKWLVDQASYVPSIILFFS